MISKARIQAVCGREIEETVSFLAMGLVSTQAPQSLSYLADERYLEELNDNGNVVAVFTTNELEGKIAGRIVRYCVADPTYAFWSLFNQETEAGYQKAGSKIDATAKVHPSAFVSAYNVGIGRDTVIEPNVTVHPDVVIGDRCIIRSGTVCGFDGFERKRTSKGILLILHDGKVIIQDDVEIGSLNSIAKGMMGRDTVVGRGTKTDSLVHIAHGVQIGDECLITACAEISGSVTIGRRCWLGPNCSIINGIKIGDEAFIGIGAVVTKSVPPAVVVAGNPARVLRRLDE